MSPARKAATVLLAFGVAALALAYARLRAPAPAARPSPVVAPPAALPSATPEPWAESRIALGLPEAGGRALAVLAADPAAPPRRLAGGFEAIEAPAWSPDGRRLAFAGRQAGNWDLYAIGSDGAGLERLTAHPAFDGAPAWSPDGSALAFVSARDGSLALHAFTLGEGEAGARRLSAEGGPVLDPRWAPEGQRIVYAQWHAGRYRIEAVEASGGGQHVLAESEDGSDLRAPAFSPEGDSLAYLRMRYGRGQLLRQAWSPGSQAPLGPSQTLAEGVAGFAWFPGGAALALLRQERGGTALTIRPLDRGAERLVAELPPGTAQLTWAAGPVGVALPTIEVPLAASDPAPRAADDRPGLVQLEGVDVPGARIHAALADDYQALRAEVRDATGRDFLGTLADAWRPLGFKSSGSAFFSWHKTGRAFDTQMELWGPGGRRDMVLLRDEAGGRTMWRMFLRAGRQDGSLGRPLEEAGWAFAASGGMPELLDEGGRRGQEVPGGYWVDFTAMAEAYGWRRIPSIRRGRLDWRQSWTGIEYWHYERRDGLRWFEAARQVYPDETLAAEMHLDRLRELDVPLNRLAALGFPPGWSGEG